MLHFSRKYLEHSKLSYRGDWYNRQPIKPSRTTENLSNDFINHTYLYKVSILYTDAAPVHLASFHRRKDVICISLHKKSFANEEIPGLEICRNAEILRIFDFQGKKTRPRVSNSIFLVLNENKISKPKRRGRAFETHGRVFKHSAECLDLIYLNSCLHLKTKHNVLICHGSFNIKLWHWHMFNLQADV